MINEYREIIGNLNLILMKKNNVYSAEKAKKPIIRHNLWISFSRKFVIVMKKDEKKAKPEANARQPK